MWKFYLLGHTEKYAMSVILGSSYLCCFFESTLDSKRYGVIILKG